MRRLFSQLRTRLILGAIAFLLALTGAVALVVRDSLQFLARNMQEQGAAQALVENSLNDILQATLLTIGYFAILVIVGVIIASRAFTNPIQKLVEGTRSIAAGDFSVRLAVKSSDELGTLAESFNRMAGELMRRRDEAERINASLSKSEERFRLAIEAAPSSMVIANETGAIIMANRQTEVLFGYSPNELIGKPIEILLPERFHGLHARLRDVILHHPESLSAEDLRSMRCRRKDGSEFPAEVSYNLIETDEGMLILGSIMDISERQQLAEARALAALEERQRLARDLHDSVTQTLYSLTLLAEASRRTAQRGDAGKVVENLARLGETAQQALKEMRLLVYELRPLALEQAGLADALRNRLEAVEKRAGVDAQLKVSLEADLHPTMENGLYRIAQEALNNALKHAGATVVSISLRSHGQTVEMEIADNGRGFQVEDVDGQGGMGLVSIRERVEEMGGACSITSAGGEGTRIWLSVPLRNQV